MADLNLHLCFFLVSAGSGGMAVGFFFRGRRSVTVAATILYCAGMLTMITAIFAAQIAILSILTAFESGSLTLTE